MPPSPRADRSLDAEVLGSWPLSHENGDKRERGTVLAIGGSVETPGAVLLAAVAALRMGAGRLQIATADEIAPAVAVAVPESRVVGWGPRAEVAAMIEAADAVVVGPGLMDRRLTAELLHLVLDHAPSTTSVVVDAGAIAALAELTEAAPGCPLILTPNRDELGMLLDGEDPDDAERVAARRYGATIASFGRVAAPDGTVWEDGAEAVGLGTSGSGDVLAGAAAGAAARSGDAVRAACWALYVHRLAGTRLSRRTGPVGYLARELADELGPAMATVHPSE